MSSTVNANENEAGTASQQAVGNRDTQIAGEGSNQGVAPHYQNNNNHMIFCLDRTTAIVLSLVALVIAGVVLGVVFGLRASKSNNSGSHIINTTVASSLPSTTATPTSKASWITSSSLSIRRTSTTVLPPPPSPTADGVHLVNYVNGTAVGSGFAYYASAVQGNNGAQPNDYAGASVDVDTKWEGRNITGYFADTKTLFWVDIHSTSAAVNQAIGIAGNGYRTFDVYKDDGRLLYKEGGVDFYSICYCQ
ncbi:MAG: hypothetical protein Q9191_006945 [Dirinaria sp. TL-2023a]